MLYEVITRARIDRRNGRPDRRARAEPRRNRVTLAQTLAGLTAGRASVDIGPVS